MEKLINYLKSDIYRQYGKASIALIIKGFFKIRLYRLLFWYRVAKYFSIKKTPLLAIISRGIYKRISLKCGVEIPLAVEIGHGCIIHHGYGLVVNSKTKIGTNVSLMHNLTFADEKGKAPTVGDRVRFTPGAVIVGDVRIGNDSVIGANCVVTKDVPNNDVAVGIPNKNLGRSYVDYANRRYWPI